jgi:MFS family permease
MSFFDRLSNGWKIAISSFKVLKEKKQLVIFPILSGISIMLIMGSFFTALLASSNWDPENIQGFDSRPLYYLMLFGFYVVNYFIVVFFNMALIHCSRLYFRGEEVTVRAGLLFSLSRIGVIFSWAFFAATVGLILRMIQENVGWLGKIITGLIGIVWSIATFFVVPIIAYENAGPIEAVKRSTQLMKQKWGESLGASFSFGLIQFLGMILVGLPLYFVGAIFHPFAGIALAIVGIFLVISIISAAQTIFVSAIYHNINGDLVKHFNQQMVDQLFEKKEKTWFK